MEVSDRSRCTHADALDEAEADVEAVVKVEFEKAFLGNGHEPSSDEEEAEDDDDVVDEEEAEDEEGAETGKGREAAFKSKSR